jgi:hypothetical protein
MGSATVIAAKCTVCKTSMKDCSDAAEDVVIRLCKFKHCGRTDYPSESIKQSYVDHRHQKMDKDLKRCSVRWLD